MHTEENSELADRNIKENRSYFHKVKEDQRIRVNKEEERAKLHLVKFHQMRQSHIK